MTAPRHRWSFGLRTMFVLMTLACCWAATEWRNVHARRQALNFLADHGARYGAGRCPRLVVDCKLDHYGGADGRVPWHRATLMGDEQVDWIWLPNSDPEMLKAAAVLSESSIHSVRK